MANAPVRSAFKYFYGHPCIDSLWNHLFQQRLASSYCATYSMTSMICGDPPRTAVAVNCDAT